MLMPERYSSPFGFIYFIDCRLLVYRLSVLPLTSCRPLEAPLIGLRFQKQKMLSLELSPLLAIPQQSQPTHPPRPCALAAPYRSSPAGSRAYLCPCCSIPPFPYPLSSAQMPYSRYQWTGYSFLASGERPIDLLGPAMRLEESWRPAPEQC